LDRGGRVQAVAVAAAVAAVLADAGARLRAPDVVLRVAVLFREPDRLRVVRRPQDEVADRVDVADAVQRAAVEAPVGSRLADAALPALALSQQDRGAAAHERRDR